MSGFLLNCVCSFITTMNCLYYLTYRYHCHKVFRLSLCSFEQAIYKGSRTDLNTSSEDTRSSQPKNRILWQHYFELLTANCQVENTKGRKFSWLEPTKLVEQGYQITISSSSLQSGYCLAYLFRLAVHNRVLIPILVNKEWIKQWNWPRKNDSWMNAIEIRFLRKL